MKDKLIITYALLGYLKETSLRDSAIIELYEPIVKKALSEYSAEYTLSEIKGRSLSEISKKVEDMFGLNIPIPILSAIMKNIAKQIDDDNVFAIYNDGAFILKSYVFYDIDQQLEVEKKNIAILQEDYRYYCDLHKYAFDFKELEQFILAQQIDLFTEKQSFFLDLNYFVSKYVHEKLNDDNIFGIMSNIYLGGVLSSYLELNITQKVTDAELLLDTNFFISLIDLNTEDSYHICKQLFDLCSQMGFKFTILQRTVEQIRILLANRIQDFANKDFIGTVRCADIFNACVRRGLDKSNLEQIRDSILKILKELNVVVITDAQIQKIIDDASKSQEFKELIKKRNNNRDSALTDTIAHFYVESRRGRVIKEFVDVKCWFLHNSYSAYEYNSGRKIHNRISISANELLILLWLSSPSQGDNIKIKDVTRGGLASYVTKYRRSKAPTKEVLRKIKKRADHIISIGVIEERDLYNIGLRMAEGNFSTEETNVLVEEENDEIFADKIKEYSEEYNQERKGLLDTISDKEKAISDKEEQIIFLEKRNKQNEFDIKDLNNRLYLIEKEKFVSDGLKKRKHYAIGYLVFIFIITLFWIINRVYSNVIEDPYATIISFVCFGLPTFGLRFIDHTTIKEFLCRGKLKERLENDFDDSKKNDSNH